MLVNMKDVLLPAQKGGYAVGLFNTVNLEQAKGVLAAAEELHSPVIIGTAEIFLPYSTLEELSYFLLPMAEKASVPVVVHLDHGLKAETCKRALELGFTSVMFDCSADDYETNIQKVREITQLAHAKGATVEAELGHVGDNEDSAEGNRLLNDPSAYYTVPSQAKDYVDRTGVDALAIAVGTAHGTYKLPPKLDFDRISEIARTIDTPLVLHGGSGLSDDDFRTAISRGISKVNIFTDINQAGAKAAVGAYQEGKGMTDMILPSIEAVKKSVMTKMRLFSSENRG